MKTLYHGSINMVKEPLVNVGRDGLDFGKGFYTTDIHEQAARWAQRLARQQKAVPVVNVYQFEYEKATDFRYLKFTAYDKSWLDFIVQCRKGFDVTKEWDIVEGGVANDRVIDIVEGYINGTVDAEHAITELAQHQPNNQICFLNQKAVDVCLKFVKIC